MRRFNVTVKDQEVKSKPDEMRVHRGSSEVFAVCLMKHTESEYELLPLHIENDPRNAVKTQQLSSSVSLLYDDNQREAEDEVEEKIKFSIGVKKRDGSEELFLDPIVVNE